MQNVIRSRQSGRRDLSERKRDAHERNESQRRPEAAIYYASIGWTVIPRAWQSPQGGTGWPSLATRDPGEAACLFEDWPHDGVGVLLGERSGSLTSSATTSKRRASLSSYSAARFRSRPVSSRRGRHYLFRLPTETATSKAKGHARGDRGQARRRESAQTVFPPSAGRSWLVAPDACEPAELPAEIVARIAETLAPKALERPAPQASSHAHGDDQLDVGRWLARRGSRSPRPRPLETSASGLSFARTLTATRRKTASVIAS